MKEHKLIVKTASFVAEKGNQIEIVIRLKQSNNPAFSFLSHESNLNQYYKHLIGLIKCGQYRLEDEDAKEVENVESDSDSDGSDAGYLHPSLMAKKTIKCDPIKVNEEPISLPQLPKTSLSDSYRKLVDSLKGHMSSDEEEIKIDPVSSSTASGHIIEAAPIINERLINAQVINFTKDAKPSKFSLLPPPPPEVETIIERLAERVAKNGLEFESDVKRRADPRFDFLNPGHCFHSFTRKENSNSSPRTKKCVLKLPKLSSRSNSHSRHRTRSNPMSMAN